MNTKKILSSKKTEYWLIAGIIIALLVSIFLSSVNPNNPKNNPENKVTDINTNLVENLTSDYETRTIQVNEQSYAVLVAESVEQRTLGLSNRTELPEGIDGMLFIFPSPDTYGIWMKDMNFNIDILWLDADFNIVDQRLNVSPDTYPESFAPSGPALYVLELPA